MTNPQEVLFLYNLGPTGERHGDPHEGAAREIKAMLHDNPLVLGLCEAIGYRLPEVRGYRRLRDVSKPGRANIAAYVRDDEKITGVRFWDMRQTWPRVEHPGTHPARSWLEFRVDGMQVFVGHQPQILPPRAGGQDATFRVQGEGIRFLTQRMAPWTRVGWLRWNKIRREKAKDMPRIALADWNRRKGWAGPGPSTLAGNIDGRVIGDLIDAAVARKTLPTEVGYPEVVNGIRLMSDHHHAFRCKVVFK